MLHTPRTGTIVSELLQEHTLVICHLKLNLLRNRQRMRAQMDNHHIDRSFAVEDWVCLRLQAHRQHSVERHLSPKLSPRFSGPYRIVRRIGTGAYELQLPPSSRIHQVFHVSLLCLFKGLPPESASNSCTTPTTHLDFPTSANPNPSNPLTAPHAFSTPQTPPGHAITKRHMTLSPAAAPLPTISNLQNLPLTGDTLANPNRDPNVTSPNHIRAPSNFEDKVECPADGNDRGEPNVLVRLTRQKK